MCPPMIGAQTMYAGAYLRRLNSMLISAKISGFYCFSTLVKTMDFSPSLSDATHVLTSFPRRNVILDYDRGRESRSRASDKNLWIPACAGMTIE
jgi:hypothetical protein